jgi:phage shock protein PspC (stress-responsive transcriptional regulator)
MKLLAKEQSWIAGLVGGVAYQLGVNPFYARLAAIFVLMASPLCWGAMFVLGYAMIAYFMHINNRRWGIIMGDPF